MAAINPGIMKEVSAMKKGILIIISLLLVLALVLAGCSKSTTTAPAAPAKTLKIGALVDLSGFLSVFYLEAQRELKITADYINEQGGITADGQKYNIELVIRDSKSSPDGALASANQLIFQDQVKFAIGPIAFEAIGTTPLFEQNKVIHVFNYTSSDPKEIGPDSPYAFVGDTSAVDFARTLAQIGKKNFPNAKTVALVHPDDGSAGVLVPKEAAELADLGYTVVNKDSVILYANDLQDFSPIVAKINALNADAVLQSASAPNAVYGILKGMRAAGKQTVYLPSVAGDFGALLKAVGTENATNLGSLYYHRGDPNNPPMLKTLDARVPSDVAQVSWTLANTLTVLVNEIKLAGTLDVDKIKTSWEAHGTLDNCLYGTGAAGGLKIYGLKNHAISFQQPYGLLQDGKIVADLPWIDPGPTP
jgi:ABC-type branched-subunit amino acid transport system substrate-binding protein